ncbi:hypothetical protein BDB01DRAFT_804994 [Pilobolus umbonatus]|nr:hypothetical protein BDB01DRAFT_804994 [Pilobolus umbonatus]
MDITPRTQSLKEMHTGFKNIYHQDVYFIKNHFSQLTSLCLSIWEIPDAEVEIIDLLMSMEHLKIMTLCIADIPDNALKNALLTFWKHAPRITPRGVYGNTAKFSSEIDEATIQFSFFYNSLHNVRFLESCTDIENIHSRLAHEVLKEIGSSLQILDLTNAINFKDSNLGLSQINSLCPNLVRLDTGVYHKNHTDLPYYPQANLKELHICFSLVNDQLLENIEHLYPQLEFLELSGIEFGPDDNNRCILTLPNIPSLRRSLFRHGDELFDELHVVVIKKYTDGTTTTRYLSPIDNKVMTAAPDTPYEELFCKERPSLLFKTKTLQTFEFKKIRFDFNTVVIVDSSLR